MTGRAVVGSSAGLIVLVTMAPALAVSASGAAQTPATAPRARWTALVSHTTEALSAVSFSDPRTGHVVGDAGTILATIDGGRTWRRQAACSTSTSCGSSSRDRITADLTGVGFWDPQRGVAVGTAGTILSTADGGRTWASRLACDGRHPCPAGSDGRTAANLAAVSVVGPSHAYAVGSGGTVLASDDYGRTWRRLATCTLEVPVDGACTDSPSGAGAELRAVVATSAWVVHGAGRAGAVFSTATGGETFGPVPICVVGQPESPGCSQGRRRAAPDLAGIAFPDSGRRGSPRIYAVGAAGVIMAETGARGWAPQFACTTTELCAESSPDRVRADLRSVVFPHDLRGYAVGTGGTIVSLELPPPAGGDTPAWYPHWRSQDSGTTSDLNSVSFPTPDVGYAVGEGGTILKSVVAAPGVQIERLNPAQGASVGRTRVKITGRGFRGATDVYFGPMRSAGFTVHSDTDITATAPPRPPGVVQLTVVTPAGPSTSTAGGRFRSLAPTGGAWRPAAACPSGCGGPAVALLDGKVLVAGGSSRGGLSGTTASEVYDPAVRAWASTAPLSEPRAEHTVTALADGRVLVAGGRASVSLPDGGFADYSLRPTAEVYEPRAGTWSRAGDMVEPRAQHTATLLSDGRVLVAGGSRGGRAGVLPTAEVWDPRSGTWSATASMGLERFAHTATALPDGTVLVVGGCNLTCAGLRAAAELYDAAAGTWRRVAPPQSPHAGHTATVLPDGDVLVVGGTAESQNAVPFAERYDLKADTWTPIAPMRVPRALHTATPLPDGTLLVAGGLIDDPAEDNDIGGEPVASAEIYDPVTDRWRLVADMPTPRVAHSAFTLQTTCGGDCGNVLIAGGEQCTCADLGHLGPPLLYEPTADRENSQLPPPGAGPGAARALLVAGGLAALLLVLLVANRARRS